MRFSRTLVQLFFLEFILYVGIKGFLGGSTLNCESYCPMGVVATFLPFVREGTLYCSMTERNLALLIGLIALTLVAGRAFCSWACPFGAVSEWLGDLGKKLGVTRKFPEGKGGTVLLSLKYLMLLAIVVFSTWAGDLVFRTYCPYFTLFSFHGHEVQILSYFVLANVLLAGLVYPLFWCQVLCPLHAFLALTSKFSLLKIHRNSESCLDCGKCDKVCPERIPVAQCVTVTDLSCSRCLGCMDACPNGTLTLGPTPARGVTPWLVPILVLGLLFGSSYLQDVVRRPTLEERYSQVAGAATERAWFIVDGLRCRGTAGALSTLLTEDGGIQGMVVYASTREAIVDFDPSLVAAEELIFRFDRELEIGGQTLHPFRCLRYRVGAEGEWQVLHEEAEIGEISVKNLERKS